MQQTQDTNPAAGLTAVREAGSARSMLVRYGVAALLTGVAIGLTALFGRFITPGVFIFFYPAVVLAARYGGAGPGLLATFVGLLTADLLFFDPVGRLYVADPGQRVFMVIFAGMASLLSWLVASLRAARLLAETREREAVALAARVTQHATALERQAVELQSQAVELEQTIEESQSARQRAEIERKRVSILAETSRALTEGSDYRLRLEAFARLIARELADFCVIDILDTSGEVMRVVASGASPEHVEAANVIQQWAPRPEDQAGVAQVLRTGQPLTVLRMDETDWSALARSPEHHEFIMRFRPRSVIIMPLRSGESILGAITLMRTGLALPFDEDDVSLVHVLALRAAVLLELARLYREAREELVRRERAERALREKADQLESLTVEQEETMAELEERTAQAQAAERMALEASQAKSQFLAVMSHELRTPLNAIMGYTDLLQTGTTGATLDERAHGFLDRIRVSVLHLRGLIDEVLSLARIEAGREDLQLERTSISEVLRDVAGMLHADALQKGLQVNVQTDGDVILTTDTGKLRQILINLASNAVKFTDQGGVTLRQRTRQFTVEIDVADTGIGIAPEDQERIFEPFTQVDQTRTRRIGGSGLGLAVSRKLALLLGGDLALHSDAGQGSTFTLILPRD